MRAYLLGLMVLCAVTGCVGDDDDSSAEGRGSLACQDWQDAICDFIEECGTGSLTRTECDRQYTGVVCRADDDASDCANFFDEAACGTVTVAQVNACDVRVIGDPIPARTACEEFNDAVCLRAIECDMFSDEATCRATLALNCTQVIVHTLDFDTCLDALSTVSCASDSPLPEACESVFLQ